MKKLILTTAITLSSLTMSAIVPEVDYETNWYSIDNINNGKRFTEVDVTFRNTPGSWVRLSSNTFLRDRDARTEYKLIKSEGFALDSQIVMDRTGHQSARLYFERVPKSVKSVDLIEFGSGASSQTYGIHLDRKRQARTITPPLTVADIYNRPGKPEPWTPPTGKRLLDEQFIVPGGCVHFKGKIDNYTPEIGNSVALFYLHNELNGVQNVSAQLDSIGNFEVDLPVEYAQNLFFTLGNFTGRAFVFPGDMVLYHGTTKELMTSDPDGNMTRDYAYEYIDSHTPETVEINLLKSALADSLKDLQTDFQIVYNVSKQGHDKMMEFGEKIKSQTREAVARLTEILTPLNISPKSKDFLFTDLLIEINEPLLEADLYYENNMYIRKTDEDGTTKLALNPDYVALDPQRYYGGREDYISYLWDNPYVLCSQQPFINRLEYGACKRRIRYVVSREKSKYVQRNLTVFDAAEELKAFTSRRDWLDNNMREQKEIYGSGNDFMSQLIITKSLLALINGAEPTTENLIEVSEICADVMRTVEYRSLQKCCLTALNSLAMKVAVNENVAVTSDPSKHISSKSEILASIVEPYKGRLVFVDVWDIYCGPCRAGMIDQKKIVEKYKDAPVTFIYIAPESSKEACEKFMAEKDIKGEHIFLSNDDDARFKADFNIQGIPYTILIRQNGEYATGISCNLDTVIEQELAK